MRLVVAVSVCDAGRRPVRSLESTGSTGGLRVDDWELPDCTRGPNRICSWGGSVDPGPDGSAVPDRRTHSSDIGRLAGSKRHSVFCRRSAAHAPLADAGSNRWARSFNSILLYGIPTESTQSQPSRWNSVFSDRFVVVPGSDDVRSRRGAESLCSLSAEVSLPARGSSVDVVR